MEQAYGAAGRRVAGTQFDSFNALTVKDLTAKQQMVIDAFDGPADKLTREDITARTNLRHSSTCGRVRELLDARRLVVVGSQRCVATGKLHEVLMLVIGGQQ